MKLKSDCGVKSEHKGQQGVQEKSCVTTESNCKNRKRKERIGWTLKEKVWEGDRGKETKAGREEKDAERERGSGWQVLKTRHGPILS